MADPTKQYDISPKQLNLEIARNARRNALRQEIQKLGGDPYRSATGEGGFPFDENLQRFISTRAKTYEYFRPTMKNGLFFHGAVLLPIFFFAWLFKSDRDKREKLYRTGQVSYADRNFKFV